MPLPATRHTLRMWVPPEDKDPVLLHAPTRKSVACFGAANIRTGTLVTAFERSSMANPSALSDAPAQASRSQQASRADSGQRRYNHARMLQPWLNQHRKVLTLMFLPPYSPELNPIERVWKLTRRLATHNRHFPRSAMWWKRSKSASVSGQDPIDSCKTMRHYLRRRV